MLHLYRLHSQKNGVGSRVVEPRAELGRMWSSRYESQHTPRSGQPNHESQIVNEQSYVLIAQESDNHESNHQLFHPLTSLIYNTLGRHPDPDYLPC